MKRIPFLLCFLFLFIASALAQDSLGISAVGRYVNSWDIARATDIQDDYAYIATSRTGLWVYDISDPANWERDTTLLYSHEVNDIIVQENLAYMISKDSLFVYSFASPTTFDRLDGIEVSQENEYFLPRMEVHDTLLVIHSFEDRFELFDISNPLIPLHLSSIIRGNPIRTVFIEDSLAILNTDENIYIYDISDPSDPFEMTRIDNDTTIVGIKTHNDFLYVCEKDNELTVRSISDPEDPGDETVFYDTGHVSAMIIENDQLYACSNGGIIVFSLADPANPSYLYTFSFTHPNYPDFVSTLRMDEGLLISPTTFLDISNPDTVTMVHERFVPDNAMNVDSYDDLAYIYSSSGKINIFDISDRTSPELISSFIELGSGYFWENSKFKLDGPTLYGWGADRFNSIDISDPMHPSINYQELPYGWGAMNMYGIPYLDEGNMVFIEDDMGFNTFYLYDIRNPQILNLNDSFPYPDRTGDVTWVRLHSIEISDSTLYLIRETTFPSSGRMRIYGMTEYGLVLQGSVALTDDHRSIEVSNGYAWVSNHNYMEAIDLNNPGGPYSIGNHEIRIEDIPFYSSNIKIYGNYLFFRAYAYGGPNKIGVLDISDPMNPEVVGYYPICDQFKDFVVRGKNIILVEDWYTTILEHEFDLPPAPFSLLSPSHNDTITLSNDGFIDLSWQESFECDDADIVSYEIHFYWEFAGAIPMHDSVSVETTSASICLSDIIPANPLEDGAQVAWQVHAISDGEETKAQHPNEFYVHPFTSVEDNFDLSLPDKFEISSLYPNPFNSYQRLTIALPDPGNLKVSLYNILGEKALSIHTGELNAGTHSLGYDANQLASGVYFLKAETTKESLVQKVLLVR